MTRFGFTQIHRWGDELYVDSTDASALDRAAETAKAVQPDCAAEVKGQSCIMRKVKKVLALQLRLVSALCEDGWEPFQVDRADSVQDWFAYYLRKAHADS